MSDSPSKGGRPRKYSADAGRVAERYAEAQRLEVERDRLAAEAERSPTMAAKAAWLAAEAQVAGAWSSALRADGKLPAAIKFAELQVKHAAAHSKAVEQLTADRVAELHRRATGRARAADLLAGDPGEETAP